VGPGVIPQCWRSGMPGRLHNWRTHPADLHPGRAQDDLRAQPGLMVQGRLDGWFLRASVRSLRTAPLAHSSGEARPERRSREGDSSPSGEGRAPRYVPGTRSDPNSKEAETSAFYSRGLSECRFVRWNALECA
jgi:hypothetical protein